MKIKFDMKYRREIESGKYKVVTADDRPVTIERWDMKGNSPVLASMMVSVYDYGGENSWEEERAFSYGKDGTCSSMCPSDAKFQLFIETGDVLTEAERMVFHMINVTFTNLGAGKPTGFSRGMKATPLCLTSCLLSLSDLRYSVGRYLPRYGRCFRF